MKYRMKPVSATYLLHNVWDTYIPTDRYIQRNLPLLLQRGHNKYEVLFS